MYMKNLVFSENNKILYIEQEYISSLSKMLKKKKKLLKSALPKMQPISIKLNIWLTAEESMDSRGFKATQ